MWEIEKVVSKGEYDYAVVTNHPRAIKYGYVLLHRVIVENHLQRLLDDSEIVHHVNGDKKDNRLDNLQVMSALEHNTQHGYEQGKKMAICKCPVCKKTFTRAFNQTHLSKPNSTYSACSRSCSGKFSRMCARPELTHEVEVAISENIVSVYRTTTPREPKELGTP